MFKCNYRVLTLSFNEFHNIEPKDMPRYGEFCLLELKDGRYTGGEWNPANYDDYAKKKSTAGNFIRGTADSISSKEVARWHSLDRYNPSNCLEEEDMGVINFGVPGDDVYSVRFDGLKSFADGDFPKSEQYCFLILDTGDLGVGRWERYDENDGAFIYAPALASYDMEEVWAWMPLSSDSFFEAEEEREKEHKREEELNRNPSTDPKLLKYGTDIDVYYEKARQKLVEKSNPEEKFKFGMDIKTYLDKAYKIVKRDYHWFDRRKIKGHVDYDIRQIDGEWEFVRDYGRSGNYHICDYGSADQFIESVENDYREYALMDNPVVASYDVPYGHVEIHGWNLERYRFDKMQSGDYKVEVQAGDRVTGGNRTFFITPECFEAQTYEEFLDRYLEIVPGQSFGLHKKDLLSNKDLKKFLGYTNKVNR